MTTKQCFLSHQWLVFCQLHRTFSFSWLLSIISHIWLLLPSWNFFVTWSDHKHSCCPFFLSKFSFSLPSPQMTCTFVHFHRFKYHFWFVGSQICREAASHLSLCTFWPLSKGHVFPHLTLIYFSGVSLNMFFSENFDTSWSRSHFPFLVYYSVLCSFFTALQV